MTLDTSEWKPFFLHRLYDIRMGNKFDKNKLDENSPEVNLVSRVSYHNGVDIKVGYVEGVKPFPAGLLTVALGGSYLGSCFVQEEPFYTAQNVAVMTPNADMTHGVNLFISGLVRFESKVKYYAFGRELNTHIKTDFDVKLPIQRNADGSPVEDSTCRYSEDGYVPDWQFMEEYIKSLHHEPLTTKNKTGQARDLNVSEWKEFRVTEIFTAIEPGKISNASDLEEGQDIPYLGAKKDNNGMMQMCVDVPEKRSRGNCVIMICDGEGSVGLANYMESDFLGTVNLMLGYNDTYLNPFTGLFVATVLSQERPKYSFGRKWKTHISETTIKLPADADGNPDWLFMENYIKSLPYGDRLADTSP